MLVSTLLMLGGATRFAQSSACTGPGRWDDGASSANGICDLRFTRYDSGGARHVAAAPGFATIWWIPATPDFTLQSTDSLSPTNWVSAPSGTNNPATVPATLPARFYRLFKP